MEKKKKKEKQKLGQKERGEERCNGDNGVRRVGSLSGLRDCEFTGGVTVSQSPQDEAHLEAQRPGKQWRVEGTEASRFFPGGWD